MINKPKNKRIFITGGAGYLGKHLVEDLIHDNELTVYSRDESKHYFLKKQYPKVNFIIGDVRNYDLLLRSTKNHDIGIFAASLKQIEACDNNYEEANKIIVEGAFNSKNAAIANKFESACFISSDKSRAPSTIYGSMKFTAGESFISNNSDIITRLSTAIYGNIINSTGSIIPLIWDAIKNNRTMELYSTDMTRFMLTINEAEQLIYSALYTSNVNVIPLAKSFRLVDLFELFSPFGLKYIITKPRPNEKIHEIMISSEEVSRSEWCNELQLYKMHKNIVETPLSFINNEYSSRDCVITKDMLSSVLQKNNYFRL
jgi:UDP-glucose 4-epimerase